MKKLSIKKMADTISAKRKEKKLTQIQLAELTGINRGMISRLEGYNYTPTIDQLQSCLLYTSFHNPADRAGDILRNVGSILPIADGF